MTIIQLGNCSDLITITNADIENIKIEATLSKNRRARYCLHPSNTDVVHQMIIAFCSNSIIPIHRHIEKSESFHVIEGELELLFYSDKGELEETVRLGTPGTGLPFIHRLENKRWHTINILSEFAVIHEITTGPFNPEEKEELIVP